MDEAKAIINQLARDQCMQEHLGLQCGAAVRLGHAKEMLLLFLQSEQRSVIGINLLIFIWNSAR